MNTKTVPRYELKSVFDDGSCTDPMVIPVADIPWDATTGRRGFLCAGMTLGALLSMADEHEPDGSAQASQTIGNTENKSVYMPHRIRAHSRDVLKVVFSPDGKFLATTAHEGDCKLWRMPDGLLVETLEGVCGGNGSLTFSPNGRMFAVESGDGSVELWGLPDTKRIMRARLDNRQATGLAFSPNGKALAFVSGDKMVELWNPDGSTAPQAPFHRDRSVHTFGYLPDGHEIVFVTQRGEITLRSVDDHISLVSFTSSNCVPESLAVFPDGKKIAIANAQDEIELWEVLAGTLASKTPTSVVAAHSIAISRDGRIVACAGEHVEVWRMPDTERSSRIPTPGSLRATCLAISPDGQYLAIGYTFGVVVLYDLETLNAITYLYDAPANDPGADGVTYTVQDEVTGYARTYTMPCGTPVPPGAVCTCNCVPGTASLTSTEPLRLKLVCPTNPVPGKYGPDEGFRPRTRVTPVPRQTTTSGQICTCDQVCVCVPICQSHRLCHRDSLVRASAYDVMVAMGRREFDYMRWAADKADSNLRWRIYEVMNVIERGQSLPLTEVGWSAEDCLRLLYNVDEVIATIGAQLLTRHNVSAMRAIHKQRAHFMLEAAAARPWYFRGH